MKIDIGPWPADKQPGDRVFETNASGNKLRIDRFGTVYINGTIVAKTYISPIEDTRDYLKQITGGP